MNNAPRQPEDTSRQRQRASVETVSSLTETAILKEDNDGNLLPGVPIPPSMTDLTLPGYRLLTILGNGGMGTVFLARQISLDRLVAVKMIKGDFAANREYADRLRGEALTMAALSHPNILGCYDIITMKQKLFLVMEYIPGKLTVRDLVCHFGSLPEQLVVRILLEAISGLSYIYEKGYLHCDLKPDNLMIHREENTTVRTIDEIFRPQGTRTVICDFGIAHNARAITKKQPEEDNEGRVIGSPMFMAPEQFVRQDSVDCRSDIYALGCTAYYMVSGEPPFSQTNRMDLLEFKLSNGIPDPHVKNRNIHRQLGEIIQKMGAVRPEERYQNYLELQKALQTLSDKIGNTRKLLRRHYLWEGLGIGAIVVLCIQYWPPFYTRRILPLLNNDQQLQSLSRTLGFWHHEGTGKWTLVNMDIDEPYPYIRGLTSHSPLLLRFPLGEGMKIEFKLRFHGKGTTMFGLQDSANQKHLEVLWIYNHEGLSSFFIRADRNQRIAISDQNLEVPGSWVSFRIEITSQRIAMIYANDKMLSMVQFEENTSFWNFFLDSKMTPFLDIKDVFKGRISE